MKASSAIDLRLALTIIALAGISVVTAASLLLAQSASATTDLMTNTTVGEEGGEETVNTTTTAINNVSNALLGRLFMVVEFKTASVNPINETYIETSTVNNVTIMPPNATTGTTINGIETVNATVNILPNGLALDKGQSLIVTEGGDDGTAAEQENATTTFVDISRMSPDGSGSGTGVVFFDTNSTGQLAFLDNMVGINQAELSPEGGNIRVWEWKGEMLPFETGGGAPITGNQTTMTSELEEEEAVSSTTNNVSNSLLGRLFSYGEGEGEDIETNVNPINETYIEVSYSGNRVILPPNDIGVINATEIGNFTINIQPNGVSINQGQADIMTEDGAAGAAAEVENATITFVLLTRTNPDGSGSGTGVTYFSTNSTGQLAFLDNTVAVAQVEYSPEEGINRFAEWEWNGGMLPFENMEIDVE
jgi:hypothetical protein